MSYSFNDEGIKFKSKTTLSITWYLLNIIGILVFSFGEYYFIKQSITKGIGGDILYLIFCPFILWGLFKYVITDCSNKLELTKDKLIIYKAKRIYDSSVEPLLIPYKSISKVRFTDDECLTINNLENDVDNSLDLAYFDNIDIQLMINHLCKNVVIEIDDELSREKGLTLPVFAVSKIIGSTSRRRNISSDKPRAENKIENTVSVRKRTITNNRKLELADNNQSGAKSNSKRRLEL